MKMIADRNMETSINLHLHLSSSNPRWSTLHVQLHIYQMSASMAAQKGLEKLPVTEWGMKVNMDIALV